ncbi:MAG: zinc-binding dehydrogenase [Microbacterium ginsengisoli]|jgi:alcohol dehydrogenase|uniref:zinc-binding dehydrogenase n=1 Tax=Microbacterium TaxID=33882 RepID=UPI0006F48C06|nr:MULTISPECIES: zinc-binding dehydrogenase [Microbacterium]MBN9197190.1 zinc-binding dehydrogenase [Microbacterium ginsengisoli]KQR91149.1 alcohol dehydrogenase [Microbacterium sp. Leaf347]KQS01161.1 alcohol dehydrogenase [Microbacterium sp. Leaf351]KXC07195.1 alcohol dehydrogenase [Microbacterium hominis]MBN9208640.1 zinc-binding dehydrogenase [Microbacterium ginsengisoli]
MKAMVYDGDGAVTVETVDDPVLAAPTDAIVRIDLTTICGSDLHILGGHVPTVTAGRVLGHEGVGTVIEAGSAVVGVSPGDRVLISGITGCGSCRYCRIRMYSQCERGGWIMGNTIHGTQAELLRVPFADRSLYRVPERLRDEQVLFLDDPVVTAYELGLQRAGVKPGESIAIVGAGAIGLSAVLLAPLFGVGKVIVVDTDDNRLEAARRFGADLTLNPRDADVLDEIRAYTGGRGVDVSLECVGAPATFETCIESLAPGGRLANIGIHGVPVELALERHWIRNLTITTGLVDIRELPTLLALAADGRLDVTPLATHAFSLADGKRAYDTFAHAAEHGAVKVTLAPHPAEVAA